MASSADVGEGEDVDYYELLGLTFSASITVKEIKKAYRDKAKTSHPDKNPDDPTAAERFQAISKAYELLLDEDRRAKYIQQCNAKLQKKRKMAEMNEETRKMREDLERREAAAKRRKMAQEGVGGYHIPVSAKERERQLQRKVREDNLKWQREMEASAEAEKRVKKRKEEERLRSRRGDTGGVRSKMEQHQPSSASDLANEDRILAMMRAKAAARAAAAAAATSTATSTTTSTTATTTSTSTSTESNASSTATSLSMGTSQ
mgnify:CR=1 FL=1